MHNTYVEQREKVWQLLLQKKGEIKGKGKKCMNDLVDGWQQKLLRDKYMVCSKQFGDDQYTLINIRRLYIQRPTISF